MLEPHQRPTALEGALLAHLATLHLPFHVNMAYPVMKQLTHSDWDFHMLFIDLFDRGYLTPVGIDDAGEPLPILYKLTELGKEAATFALSKS